MKTCRSIGYVLLFLFYAIPKINAQNAISATGHITAEVIPIYTAIETAEMNFGRFSPGIQGGQIILTPESTVSLMGSIRQGIGIHNAASFYISGDADATFNITLPASPVLLRHSESSKTMLIENWLSNPGSDTGAGVLQNGEQIIHIGATLKVGSIQDNPVGVYAGTYVVTFDFN